MLIVSQKELKISFHESKRLAVDWVELKINKNNVLLEIPNAMYNQLYLETVYLDNDIIVPRR